MAVKDLDVYYGHVHVLQKVSFALEHKGVLGIVGRNGMGKTTLCNAIMGLVRPGGGSIRLAGGEISGLDSYSIVDQGVGYVPQGRRVWPSLTVDEHLKVSYRENGPWTLEKVYDTFPRLAERKRNGGDQLSGGEQQMLAIGRALVANPKLLIMDEPTEGLAPKIVKQVEDLLLRLAQEDDLAILLVEQNLGVATSVAQRLAVMVNGRIETEMDSAVLAADRALQQRLLGVNSEDDDLTVEMEQPSFVPEDRQPAPSPPGPSVPGAPARIQTSGATGFANCWSHGNPLAQQVQQAQAKVGIAQQITRWGRIVNLAGPKVPAPAAPIAAAPAAVPAPSMASGTVYVVGTFDTKERELLFIADHIASQGIRVKTVDLGTSEKSTKADIPSSKVARHHPQGPDRVFTGDRGTAIAGMALAFKNFLAARDDVIGILCAGGSGATALATPAMQALDVGVPKIMVSTVASGDVEAYVGATDICMIYSVTDVAGINRISHRVLSNAANALVGMISGKKPAGIQHKPAIGLTMFGVTTPCVQAVAKKLEHKYDCLIFHATGTGGRSMEKLVDSSIFSGVIDITSTEITDYLCGGVFSAGEDRMGAMIRSGIPYVGSCGAADMINFGSPDTVPQKYQDRIIYPHNPQVTLVRITAEESARIGRWIGAKLNQMQGPVRYFLPEGGVSLLDIPGAVFYDAQADKALFEAIESTVQQTERRRVIRLPYDINNPAFSDALVGAFNEIMP